MFQGSSQVLNFVLSVQIFKNVVGKWFIFVFSIERMQIEANDNLNGTLNYAEEGDDAVDGGDDCSGEVDGGIETRKIYKYEQPLVQVVDQLLQLRQELKIFVGHGRTARVGTRMGSLNTRCYCRRNCFLSRTWDMSRNQVRQPIVELKENSCLAVVLGTFVEMLKTVGTVIRMPKPLMDRRRCCCYRNFVVGRRVPELERTEELGQVPQSRVVGMRTLAVD